MIRSIFTCYTKTSRRLSLLGALFCLATLAMPAAGQSPTPLADAPIFASADVPGNLAFPVSVEFPTAISVANLNDYLDATTYFGYFDPVKCYTYSYNSTTPSSSYFAPAALATGTNKHSCSGQWSGNFMNWATMQTIDPFRWALTGGYRSVDTSTQTILEKAWGSNQGAITNFPYRGTTQPTGHKLTTTSTLTLGSVTPFSAWSNFTSAIWSNGNAMVFSADSSNGSGSTAATYKTAASSATDLSTVDSSTVNKSGNTTAYRVYVRVSVCDTTSTPGLALESNCVGYGTKTGSTYSSYKPEGLMQKYSSKIRFAALSYLNGSGQTREGGVLREPMGYIGPTYPQPLTSTAVTNTRSEWDATTGIMNNNPDTATASGSSVSQSGVMNFLNKFGETSHNYMTYDNVSELYYAAIRYFENLGNVPEWTNSASTAELDGFPAVTTWTDPILYRCQKNFILGIGDDHTWYDSSVGGGTPLGSRSKPAAVSSDTFNKADTWTTALQGLERPTLAATETWPQDTGATYYIAGLAYGAHVLDIRSDLADTQTISTYWMDVMEYQRAEDRNPYWLAAKYGGFTVPNNYSITNTTPLTLGQFDTTGASLNMNGNTRDLPDNYFQAGSAQQMVTSLTSAFQNIVNAIHAFTTSFSLTSPVVASGEMSFASQYNSSNWTSVITGSNLVINSDQSITTTQSWISSTTLESQLTGTGWQNHRSIATWNGSKGVPFEWNNISSTEQAALSPSSYAPSGTTANMVLNYLRGDRTNEVGSTASGSQKSLRARALLLGDIVDASLVPIGPPRASYADSLNPDYSTFKSTWSSRPTVVYAAANDGMLHAFLGSTGAEQFAYVPSATFQGPSSTPQTNGLAALANPNYSHYFYVDATPGVFDLDFNRTNGNTSGSSNWQSLLIGGLGKGGKGYYAINVTNPATLNNETTLANAVAWEFTDSTMGYSFGQPGVVKTAKYGWVVLLTSGYDNSDGYGYLYVVNPTNGSLLEKIKTPSLSNGMTQGVAYVPDLTDYKADSYYVGDLNGQLWRFDLRGTGAYPAPTLLATLTDGGSTPHAQPITAPPVVAVHPTTRMRYVMLGTGQLLASQDVNSTATTGTQTFYAIVDGTTGAFKAVSTAITRSDLNQVTSLLNGIPSTTTGWYYDFPAGQRVTIPTIDFNGVAAFAALSVTNDPCSPQGTSTVYATNYATGKTVLYTLGNATVPMISFGITNAVTNLEFLKGPSGVELVAGDTKGGIAPVPANLSAAVATRLLNWSEVPTAQ